MNLLDKKNFYSTNENISKSTKNIESPFSLDVLKVNIYYTKNDIMKKKNEMNEINLKYNQLMKDNETFKYLIGKLIGIDEEKEEKKEEEKKENKEKIEEKENEEEEEEEEEEEKEEKEEKEKEEENSKKSKKEKKDNKNKNKNKKKKSNKEKNKESLKIKVLKIQLSNYKKAIKKTNEKIEDLKTKKNTSKYLELNENLIASEKNLDNVNKEALEMEIKLYNDEKEKNELITRLKYYNDIGSKAYENYDKSISKINSIENNLKKLEKKEKKIQKDLENKEKKLNSNNEKKKKKKIK